MSLLFYYIPKVHYASNLHIGTFLNQDKLGFILKYPLWSLNMKSYPISISASRIRYEITRGNFGGAFAVKNMTGAIYVAGQLDYETRKRVRKYFE